MKICGIGKDNINWKGGIAEYANHAQMKHVRKQKLESVHWVCELCGGKATEIHHKDGRKSNHDITNLIATCHKCHMSKLHKTMKRRPALLYHGKTIKELITLTDLSYTTIYKFIKNKKQSKLVKFMIDTLLQEREVA